MPVPISRRISRLTAATFAALLAVPAVAVGPAAAAPDAGTVHLTVTRPDGTPARGYVSLVPPPPGGEDGPTPQLDETGQLSTDVPAGDYRILITPTPNDPDQPDEGLAQWVHGASQYEQADVISVAAGATTEVTERLLVPGSVTVTARDARDGAPVTHLCAWAAGRWGCTDSDTGVTLSDLTPGPQPIWVYEQTGRYLPTETTAVLVEGGTVAVTVDLEPAATIETTIVDAATGAPVPGACGAVAPAGTGRLPDGAPWCADDTGKLRLDSLRAGSYNLFVRPNEGTGYGAQWVGADGGTGDASSAATVTVAAGETVNGPTVRLDRAGVITGVVTSAATGAPVTTGIVSLSAFGRVGASFDADLDEQGRYRLDWLGPYDWPLLFTTDGHARQWSGGVAERRRAERVTVHSGQTTDYSPALQVGTVLTGRISDPQGTPTTAEFDVYNARTGDPMGGGYAPDGTYRSLVLGGQFVKIQWYWSQPYVFRTGWYDDDADFDQAKRVWIPRHGDKTLNLVVDPGSTATLAADSWSPPRGPQPVGPVR